MNLASSHSLNTVASLRSWRSVRIASIRTLASHAYHPPSSPNAHASSSRSPLPATATTSTPADLSPQQRLLIERTIRVDQAGELGANWIYKGQKLVMDVLGEKKTAQQVEVRRLDCLTASVFLSDILSDTPIFDSQEMWETERHHL